MMQRSLLQNLCWHLHSAYAVLSPAAIASRPNDRAAHAASLPAAPVASKHCNFTASSASPTPAAAVLRCSPPAPRQPCAPPLCLPHPAPPRHPLPLLWRQSSQHLHPPCTASTPSWCWCTTPCPWWCSLCLCSPCLCTTSMANGAVRTTGALACFHWTPG
jgi:hypothetical protein